MLFDLLELVMTEKSKLLIDIPEFVNGEIYVRYIKKYFINVRLASSRLLPYSNVVGGARNLNT
jgi:hypothetical protein